MFSPFSPPSSPLPSSRRRFVKGLAAGGVLASFPGWLRAEETRPYTRTGHAPVLSGPEIQLTISESWVNFTGTPGIATTINGSLPGPTLYLREGEEVSIRVTNQLRETTSLHWHGLIVPYTMDGVPGISFAGIAPGASFTYRFRLQQHGTYWYHAHSGMQELTGVYGAIIIEPRKGDRGDSLHADRTHLVMLSDWSDEDPMRMLSKLKAQGDTYSAHPPTLAGFFRDMVAEGPSAAIQKRQMWNEMRMSPTDLADISGHALTYLMNGTPPAGNWTGLFKPGERVRLCFINAAGHTFYDVRLPGLKMTVIQSDGGRVVPVTVDEFRFGPGETYDVLVTPQEEAHTIFAQSMDRSGYAAGTLATRPGLQAAIPAVDPVEWLNMTDMMGNMPHTGHETHTPAPHASAHDIHNTHAHPTGHPGSPRPAPQVRHARTEYGPSTDMRVDTPRTSLDDPGVGLRHNGRRVLTLADLSSLEGPLDPGGPEREIELHLTGNMARYIWSFDGLEFGGSTPIHFRYGERLRVILHNDTMMTHPMHLHGLWSELETPQGQFQVRRHTIPVQPAQRLSFLVSADALGRWAWHCHLMFHMDGGMFREVVVS